MDDPRGALDERAGRLRALDLLRFVAAMAVVLFHYTGRDSPAWGQSVREVFPSLSRLTIYGGFGPYLFFMISGFVVLMSAWGRPVSAFLGSRVGRLYPAYWVAVLGTAAALYLDRPFLPVLDQLHLSGVALNLTMFQSAFGVGHVDGVYWTLWVELQFYVLVAVLSFVGITRQRVLALTLLWPLAGALANQAHLDLVVGLLQPTYAPFFCIGVLLYLVHREGWTSGIGLLLGFNYVVALSVCSSYYIPWSIAVAGAPVSFRGLALLLTACIGALALVTLTPVARLDWRWLTGLGALTYPLYLVHEVPGWILIHRLAPSLPAHVVVAGTVVSVLLVAYLVHRFVERPLGPRLRRAVERELAGADAAARPIRRRRAGRPDAGGPLRAPVHPLAGQRAVWDRDGATAEIPVDRLQPVGSGHPAPARGHLLPEAPPAQGPTERQSRRRSPIT